ncbi:MAG TPA: hypothetical protein VKV95_02615 [Terriglobia bacterium]|nr:hypothetical protein [Terriglobia bacterium]
MANKRRYGTFERREFLKKVTTEESSSAVMAWRLASPSAESLMTRNRL